MCEPWGSTKPKGTMKVKAFLQVSLGRIPSFGGGARLARLRGIVPEAEQEYTRWDPKDGELCLSRTKSEETLMEVSSGSDVQIDRQT